MLRHVDILMLTRCFHYNESIRTVGWIDVSGLGGCSVWKSGYSNMEGGERAHVENLEYFYEKL